MGFTHQTFVFVAVMMVATVSRVHGSHFRGGTISWKSEGGYKVHFYYRLGWTYGSGPGCKPNLIGQLVTGFSDYWTCQSNNCGTNNLHDVNYICTGANQAEDWEQGKNDFVYTFPNAGPFTIGYSSGAWISMTNGKGGGNWNVATTVDLRTRSDTGKPNSSPVSTSKPIYSVQFDCEIRLKLPVLDPDNDTVRCRWASGTECESVCNALPFARLDEKTCTLVFNSTLANGYAKNGIYAVAIMIDDYPRIPMTLGGSTAKSPSDILSSVPLQFLITTIPQGGPCDAGPRFVPPTPKENQVITVEEGNTATIDLYTDNKNDTSSKPNVITSSGPVSMAQSPVIPDVTRTNTFTTTLSWKTTHNDLGSHIVCADVANDRGKRGEQRCFAIQVVPKGCKPSPCQNNGKCVANMGAYKCVCRPGYKGKNCQVNIDDCVSNHCSPGTYCLDGINAYTCHNITTTTTTTQMTTTEKNYTGMCPLEYEHCQCVIRPNEGHSWLKLSRQARDTLCFLFGFPIGLVLSVFTVFCMLRPCDSSWNNGGIRPRRSVKSKMEQRTKGYEVKK